MNWQRRSRYRERASLHEEPYFEHQRMAEKEDRVPPFIETSGRIGKGQCHDWHAGLKGFEANLGRVFRSFRRLTLRRLSESIPSVAADRLRSVNADPSTRAGMPGNT